MKDAMLQVQLLVPLLQTDAKVTANLNHVDGFTLELESDLKIPETASVQKVILKYGTLHLLKCEDVKYCILLMGVFQHNVKNLIFKNKMFRC